MTLLSILPLQEFGFNIPLENSRWERTFCELDLHVPNFKQYHYSGPWFPIEKLDLYLAHKKRLYPSTLLQSRATGTQGL